MPVPAHPLLDAPRLASVPTQVVELLLAAGANVKSTDIDGESALHWAARCVQMADPVLSLISLLGFNDGELHTRFT